MNASSKNALLYVFYGSPVTCANRLRIFRELNPDILLFGICTAGVKHQNQYRKAQEILDDLWFLPDLDPKWCWHNLDKVACKWFLERGSCLHFCKILVVDWDVLLLDPVEKWLSQIVANQVKFISVRENLKPEENHWTSLPEFQGFQTQCEIQNDKRRGLFDAILFAYACSKLDFAKFASKVVDSPGYCEYRLPSVIFNAGLELGNFEKPQNWHTFANVNGISISRSIIQNEHARSGGFQLFHPVYEPYCDANLNLSIVDVIREGSIFKSLSRKVKNQIKKVGVSFK
jgi:hypothetical protein